MDDKIAVYVGTYAKYNNGSLEGEWVDLDDYDNYDDFIKKCLDIHSDEEEPELMFQDYEGFPKEFYSESAIDKELFEYLALDDKEKEILEAFIDCHGYNYDYSLGVYYDAYIGKYESLEELAEEFIEQGLFGDVPENLYHYLDYEKIARDLSYDYTHHTTGHVFCDHW